MRALFFSIALIIMSALPSLAVDVLIVQSSNGPAYADAVRGFRDAYKGSSQTILLSDYAEVDVVRLVKEEQPRIVLALGDPALAASKKVRQVPVVALMALSFNLQKPPAPNFHGISILPPPSRYLDLFSSMGAKRVGVLYNPDRTGNYLKLARQAAQSNGPQLVIAEVHNPNETLVKLEQIKGAVDAIWMIPDATTVTSETVDAFFTFSVRQQLPLISFSEKHLPKGAAAVIEIDRVDMGKQAGELATSILNKGAGHAGSAADPRKTVIHKNNIVLEKLKISIPNIGLSTN